MKERVGELLQRFAGVTAKIRDITKLFGDASYRTYFRAILEDGRTFILMQMPEGKSSASEEITNFTGKLSELPFINIARYLSNGELPVPRVFGYDASSRLMILEDLGDDLMAKKVEGANEATQRPWYLKAIDLLVRLQTITREGTPRDCVAFARSFNATLLNWEFDHFLEYGLTACGIVVSDADRKIFNEETRRITEAIGHFATSFTHRDFQSRNLIVRQNVLHLIDFQDALVGPAVYDLVALTRDSYIELSPRLLNELIEYYAKQTRRSIDEVKREHHIVTVQRKLKDAGRFVYIDRVKKNQSFLKYIPTSLGYVRAALEQLPEYGKFFEMLKKYIPELNNSPPL